ncbi:DUF4862 family protein [Arachnia propionica]|uniref:DUF4862 family protein n=1 Tax=Arachnia propionica TaxID=1750 RepID=A0A3P1T3P5_9ACTN|nr:DUF4862 family protein [Arachnia propionica]RRD04147.1 DUF4862 family protein [Arachnia propionica]
MKHLVVGAYAALPAERADQERFYDELAGRGLAEGLEIPFVDTLHTDPEWFAAQVQGRFTRSVVTAIPGTMQRVWRDATFGLASPDEEGRARAVAWVTEIRRAAEDLNQRLGEQSIAWLHIHSAPSVTADGAAFARSLTELTEAQGFTTELVIEHCDAHDPAIPGEKRFLSLEAELEAAPGFGFAVNWGRSALEAHDPERPRHHVETLVARGRLRGLMFSGAGASDTRWGAAWADLHLPLSSDEPSSLMTPQRVAECLTAAGDVAYTGAKVQAPSDADVETRLGVIASVIDLLR